jgi:hypothetical protein
MKIQTFLSGFMLTVLGSIFSLYALAQEEGGKINVDVTKTTTDTTTWYTAPWVWIVGIAVFILIFAAIVRGGGSSSTHHEA